jgi:hypothetical protein
MAVGWSKSEVDLAIADYMSMLSAELLGQPYNKTSHRNALLPFLSGRTPGSVERKHQNISAVLIELGLPYISGYKPLGNYQALLAEQVVAHLSASPDVIQVVGNSVDSPADPAMVSDYLDRLVEPPKPSDYTYPMVREKPSGPANPVKVNYLEKEARNASLGKAGELFVVEYEKARLVHSGKDQLAERIEHVSELYGDGLGFDVRSFEANGSDRLIEVKTTAGGKQTPFFVSRNELQVSREQNRAYHLYRVFGFRRDPRLFAVNGALDQVCRLEASVYSARVG